MNEENFEVFPPLDEENELSRDVELMGYVITLSENNEEFLTDEELMNHLKTLFQENIELFEFLMEVPEEDFAAMLPDDSSLQIFSDLKRILQEHKEYFNFLKKLNEKQNESSKVFSLFMMSTEQRNSIKILDLSYQNLSLYYDNEWNEICRIIGKCENITAIDLSGNIFDIIMEDRLTILENSLKNCKKLKTCNFLDSEINEMENKHIEALGKVFPYVVNCYVKDLNNKLVNSEKIRHLQSQSGCVLRESLALHQIQKQYGFTIDILKATSDFLDKSEQVRKKVESAENNKPNSALFFKYFSKYDCLPLPSRKRKFDEPEVSVKKVCP